VIKCGRLFIKIDPNKYFGIDGREVPYGIKIKG